MARLILINLLYHNQQHKAKRLPQNQENKGLKYN